MKVYGIKDVIGFHGDTVKGLKSAFYEAVDDYSEACKAIGKKPQKPYSGNLMLRIPPEVLAAVATAAEAYGQSIINGLLMRFRESRNYIFKTILLFTRESEYRKSYSIIISAG